MKTFSVLLISLFAVSSVFASGKKPGKFGPGGLNPGHPAFAALESSAFTPQERERLKKLAKDDPTAFASEMRNHFHAHRQKKAKEMLALRQAYLDAASPDLKKVARAKIQDAVRKDMENHLDFRQKWLEYTEKTIKQLEKRLNGMRKRYEKQLAEKDSIIAKRTEELIAEQPPERLVRDAAGDFRRPQKPFRKPGSARSPQKEPTR